MSGASEDDGRRRVLVRIHGKVQGVWFRAWTEETAIRLGLQGWVRNRRDGTVEALFDGAVDAVEAMLEACREGPRLAQVTSVEGHEQPAPEAGQGTPGFHQRPTI